MSNKGQEKSKAQEEMQHALLESQRKEHLLMQKLATKEKELNQCLQQIDQLRVHTNSSSSNQLRSMMLQPAANVMFQQMHKQLAECEDKLQQTQHDLSAWRFTPDSQTGKRLMARIRQLHDDNSELSQELSAASVAKLEAEIAAEKNLLNELKRTHCEQEQLLTEIDDESELLQSTIMILQHQLTQAQSRIDHLQQQLHDPSAGAAAGDGVGAALGIAAQAVQGYQSSTAAAAAAAAAAAGKC